MEPGDVNVFWENISTTENINVIKTKRRKNQMNKNVSLNPEFNSKIIHFTQFICKGIALDQMVSDTS